MKRNFQLKTLLLRKKTLCPLLIVVILSSYGIARRRNLTVYTAKCKIYKHKIATSVSIPRFFS